MGTECRIHFTWSDEIVELKKPTYIIIDETQVIYGGCVPILQRNHVKPHISYHTNIRVLLMEAYNIEPLRTPIQFLHAMGLDFSPIVILGALFASDKIYSAAQST